MKKTALLLLFFLSALTAAAGTAEADSTVTVWGNVRDVFDYKYLTGVRVELLDARDSTVVAADASRDYSLRYEGSLRERVRLDSKPADYIYYKFSVRPGQYLLRFSREGYAPLVQPADVPGKQHGRPVTLWKAPDALLQRMRTRELGEAVVTATRVMMVNKGDTVVFNADYFQLAQGNMLDKLIEMIPGLEIKPGGQILYNGSPLSTLLVNGKDFFNGDASVALRNLPAYMVKNVKIYRKEADDAYLSAKAYRKLQNAEAEAAATATAGKDMAAGNDTAPAAGNDGTDGDNPYSREPGQKPNTLDIVLKREYSRGWIVNAEAGAGPALGTDKAWGSHTKYLGRLFALFYGNHMRLGVTGNFNDISDTQVADGKGQWSQGWKPENGMLKLAYGAVNFATESKNEKRKYSATLKATRETTDIGQKASSTTFRDAGDTFRRQAVTGRDRQTKLNFDNRFEWSGKRVYLNYMAGAAYGETRSGRDTRQAQFAADPLDSYRGASLDSLFAGPASPRLQAMLVNRLEQGTLNRQKDWSANFKPYMKLLLPRLGSSWQIWPSASYDRSSSETFERYDLRLADGAARDFRNRYFEQPSHRLVLRVDSRFNFEEMIRHRVLRQILDRLDYDYRRTHTVGRRAIYDLHALAPEEVPGAPGLLPSAAGWREAAADVRNSYRQRKTEQYHMLRAILDYGKKRWGTIYFAPQLEIYRNRYTDTRSQRKADDRRSYFSPGLRYTWKRKHPGGVYLKNLLDINYDWKHAAPPVGYLLDIRDDSNPLALWLGNPNLRGAATHELSAYYLHAPKAAPHVTLEYEFRKTRHALAMGSSYDSRTGAYTYRPENVDGNWDSKLSLHINHTLDDRKRWTLSSETRWHYIHSADLLDGARSVVRNHSAGETLALDCRLGRRGNLALRATADYWHAASGREGYRTRDTWDLQYGPRLSLNLPADLHLTTDFTLYQRRGYDDRAMNDNDLVWNAALGWDFDLRRSSYRSYTYDGWLRTRAKGTGARPWTLRLEARDLLHQLGNTRRTVNAQGVTETWYNTVPAYVMLHIAYRFARAPKGYGAPQIP